MKHTFYQTNRKNYLAEVNSNSITVLFSGSVFQQSADNYFPFAVNKNFYYLTGINQANVTLILVKGENYTDELLFIERNDELMAKWVGRKLTIEEVKATSGVDKVYYLEDFDKVLHNLLNPHRRSTLMTNTVYLDLERRQDLDYHHKGLRFGQQLRHDYPELDIKNAYHLIVSLRMIKTPEEVELIKASIDTTKHALEAVMKNIKPDLYEYQIESYFNQYIKFNGNKDIAFETICAAGKNATILHYVDNNTIAKADDLILFDLGCQTEFYISDISRTYPVSGKFSPRQAEVYQTVLEVNKKCIEFVKPGITWVEFNNYANSLLVEGLKKLGKIKEDKELVNYYWHSIGHSIGLDTHDPVIATMPLKENMVVTIEPGLYLEDEGIGIRIEDNVLLTKDKAINLSKDLIKEIKDIEAFMK